MKYKIIFIIYLVFISSAEAKDSDSEYIDCLQKSMTTGSHNLTAEEIRSLCSEIAGTVNPVYKFVGDKMMPSNEFTKCYDKESKTLNELDIENSKDVAGLVCKHGVSIKLQD